MGAFDATQKGATYIPILNAVAMAACRMAAVQSADFSATAGWIYPIDTTGKTVTLPASPAVNDRIFLFGTTDSVVSVTLSRNGSNINGAASNLTITLYGPIDLCITYISASLGWRVIQSGGSAALGWSVLTGTATLAKATAYILKTGSYNVTLPASPNAGDWVRLAVAKYDVPTVTVQRNGANINSAASDFVIHDNSAKYAFDWDITFVYVDSTIGWQVLVTRGYCKKVVAISTNTLTLDLERGIWPELVFTVSLNANISTFNINNPPASGAPYFFEVALTADGTQRTITYPASFKFDQGVTPTPPSTNGKVHRVGADGWDGGTTWYAGLLAQSQ